MESYRSKDEGVESTQKELRCIHKFYRRPKNISGNNVFEAIKARQHHPFGQHNKGPKRQGYLLDFLAHGHRPAYINQIKRQQLTSTIAPQAIHYLPTGQVNPIPPQFRYHPQGS